MTQTQMPTQTVLSYEPMDLTFSFGSGGTRVPASLPIVGNIVSQFGVKLADLARRARRMGPVDTGTVVLVCGGAAEIGCTTMSLALASACGEKALLVDGDFRRAGLTRETGTRPLHGWVEALKGDCRFEDTARTIDEQGLCTIQPLGSNVETPEKLLSKPALAAWLNQCRHDRDLTIIDAGRVDEQGAAWAKLADVALLVCGPAQTHGHDWARAWDQLEESGVHVLGIIETMTVEGSGDC